MLVLKVVAEGITTSFRYPHFMQQVHPSFDTPPPATIYGHIASALGEWFDPKGVKFAYHFTYSAKARDKEHIIVLTAATGVLKGTQEPKVLEGNVNPFDRELLFHPRLTLYINRPEWEPHFRHPHYPVVLGRSQDLFTYTQVGLVEIQRADSAYFENTILPYRANRRTYRGYAVLLPRYLDYANKRQATFDRYFIIRDRVESKDFLWFEEQPGEPPTEYYWVDPETPEVNGAHRGLEWISFVEDDNEAGPLATLD